MTTEQLLDAFKDMTLLELSAFVKEFEETFGVTAQAPVTVQQQVQAPDQLPEVEEQDEFSVILTGVGPRKIQVIKEVRVITKLGLADAKALVEDLPNPVLENVSRQDAEKARTALEAAGAIVEMK